MKAERRIADRKSIDYISVTELTSLSTYSVIARLGIIADASITGFLLIIDRKDIVPKNLKQNLTLDELVGQKMVMYLPQMNLDLDGRVTRADHKGKGVYEVAIEFSDDVPQYWRECLIDLLPEPGEMDDE